MSNFIPLHDQTLLNKFLFSVVMSKTENLEPLLQIILGDDSIKLIGDAHTEKEILKTPDKRSIRLDVFASDMDAYYDVEPQTRNLHNLPKRSRYYQGLIDSDQFVPGTIDFNLLPNSYIIAIMPFDMFGADKFIYTFRAVCDENASITLDDGAVRIFINTKGKNYNEVSPEFLQLISIFDKAVATTENDTVRINNLKERIETIKHNKEVTAEYMLLWEDKIYELKEAEEKGKAEGIELGKAEAAKEYQALLDETKALRAEIERLKAVANK